MSQGGRVLSSVLVSVMAQSRHPQADRATLSRRLRLTTSRAVVMGQPIPGGSGTYRITAWSHELPPLVPNDSTDLDAALVPLLRRLAKHRKKLTKLERRWDMLIVCTASPRAATQAGVILGPEACYRLGALGWSLAVNVVPDPELSHDNPGVRVARLHRGHLTAPFRTTFQRTRRALTRTRAHAADLMHKPTSSIALICRWSLCDAATRLAGRIRV